MATPSPSPHHSPFAGQLEGSIRATVSGLSEIQKASTQGPLVLDKIAAIRTAEKLDSHTFLEMAKLHAQGVHCFESDFSAVASIAKMSVAYHHHREEESFGMNVGYGPVVLGVRSDNFEESENYNAYLVGGTLIKLKRACRFCPLRSGDDIPIETEFALNTGVTLTRLN